MVSYSHIPQGQIKPEWTKTKDKYCACFYMPYYDEIILLLKEAHKSLHLGRDRMREEIHRLGFSWEGYSWY